MTHKRIVPREGEAGKTPSLYLSPSGDLYEMPTDPAALMAALRFQRRLTAHLVNVIRFLATSKGGGR